MGFRKKPPRLNFVSVTIFLAIAGMVYVAVQFGPPYFRRWEVQSALDSSLNVCFRKRAVDDDDLENFFPIIAEKTTRELRKIGVKDPALVVQFDRRERMFIGEAEYEEVIEHPYIKKVTILKFQITRQKSFGETD
ncbi:MAG: hypothetical protein V1754_10025 [Pseudomonadota bacterium]